MKEAVIVSTARTPIGKAFRGAFNDTEAPLMGGHVVREALIRAGVEPGEVDDVIMGAAAQQGTQAYNLGRLCAVAAGLPSSVAGMAVERQCSSGLMSIALAAKSIMCDEIDIAVAGGKGQAEIGGFDYCSHTSAPLTDSTTSSHLSPMGRGIGASAGTFFSSSGRRWRVAPDEGEATNTLRTLIKPPSPEYPSAPPCAGRPIPSTGSVPGSQGFSPRAQRTCHGPARSLLRFQRWRPCRG